MTPEADRKRLREALASLKRGSGSPMTKEVKLRDVREEDYFDFLVRLNNLNGILFSVATDAGLNGIPDITKHQEEQAGKITEHKAVMKYESGQLALQSLADQVKNLAPQLYVQLHCQVNLISSLVLNGVLYFVQRFPKALGTFRWRIDQKNSTQTDFEKAFVTLTPPLLQTISLREPLPMLEGADYSAFSRFDYPEGETPTYLKTEYGIDIHGDTGLNIGKLIQEDLKFEDSKDNHGVQVADFLASGLRRCLRGQFSHNQRAARLLGGLMIRGKAKRPPVWLLGFGGEPGCVNDEVAGLVNLMGVSSRAMLAR